MRDAVRRACTTAGSAARFALRPASVRGVAREVGWLAAHAALYPTGLVRERPVDSESRYSLQGLPPARRGLVISDVEAAGTPILLVHGLVDNRSVFAMLRRGLRRRGFGRVVSVNYSVFTADVRQASVELADVVERLVDETGYERIHVVSHSLGGLIARYYVQRRGGDARVHTLVTIGSPHGGTVLARMVPHPLCRQLRPGSDLVRELAMPAEGCRTRFLAFHGELDQVVVPRRYGRIEHPHLQARNVLVPGCGHMSLPFAGRVGHEVCATLAHLDHHGGAAVEAHESTALEAHESTALEAHKGTALEAHEGTALEAAVTAVPHPTPLLSQFRPVGYRSRQFE